jgi:Uma2 family endonuclease
MSLGYSRLMMHAAMIPASMLEERRRLGHDRFDEVWEGVLHMVPFPTPVHQLVERNLFLALNTVAERRSLLAILNTGLYDPKTRGHASYRGPDISIIDRSALSDRGIEGVAHLVVEIISPDDESRDKLPFYARVGVREVWLLDPSKKTIEVFAGMTPIAPEGGRVAAPSLGLVLHIVGSTLHIQDGADMYEVDIRDTL